MGQQKKMPCSKLWHHSCGAILQTCKMQKVLNHSTLTQGSRKGNKLKHLIHSRARVLEWNSWSREGKADGLMEAPGWW